MLAGGGISILWAGWCFGDGKGRGASRRVEDTRPLLTHSTQTILFLILLAVDDTAWLQQELLLLHAIVDVAG